MTNRDFLKTISANEALPADVREHADKMLAQMDATLESARLSPLRRLLPMNLSKRQSLNG